MVRATSDDVSDEGFVDGYLAFLLAKASHLVSGGFHRQLKELGVSIATWRILIKRSREAANRRSVTVSLEPRGRALAAKLVPLANAHEGEAFSALSLAERKALVRMLQRTIATNA